MSRYDGSDFYCIPGSEVLRNLANLPTQTALDAFEADVTAIRIMEAIETPITGNYDLPHLCRMHQHVFQDVYDWAGQLRMVDISKGDSRFANFGLIESYLGGVLAQIERQDFLRGLGPEDFVEKLAFIMSEINAAHPFREGNGRVQRLFCAQLAEQAGYFIDFDLAAKDDILKAMIAAFQGNETPLRAMLADITARIEG
ncbi:MAG: Fic/DOC family protein [Fluviibacter phosphoraccumulans]